MVDSVILDILRKPDAERTESDIDKLEAWLAAQNIVFFRKLTKPVVRDLCRCFKYESIPPHTLLFNQGDLSSKLYLVIAGSVSLWVKNDARDMHYPKPSEKRPVMRFLKQMLTTQSVTPAPQRLQLELGSGIIGHKNKRQPHKRASLKTFNTVRIKKSVAPKQDAIAEGDSDEEDEDEDEEEDDDEDDENATGDSPNKKTTVATTTTSIKPSSGTNSPLARARALAEEDDAAARRPERRQSLAQILAEEHGTHDDLHHLEPTITPADAQPKQPSPGQSGGRSLRDRQQGDDNDEVKQDGTPAPLISPASRNRLRMSSSRHKLNKDPTQSTSGKADDQMIFIGMLRAGGPRVSFGELGLIHNARRSATIMTGSTQSDFLTVDKTAFDRVLKARYAEDLEAKVQQLKQIELFAGMSDEHLSKIALHLQKRIVGPKQDLIKAGSKPNHIFFITKGCVEVREHVSASSPSSSRGSGGGGLDEVKQQAHSPLERPTSANAANRKRQSLRALRSTSKDTYRTIEVLKAGNIFGEHCLSTPPMPQPHDVRSLTETELIVLDKQDFLRRVKGDLVQKVLDDTQLRHKKIKEKMNQGSGDGQSQTLPSPSGRLHVDAVAAARTAAMAASDHVTSEPTTPIY